MTRRRAWPIVLIVGWSAVVVAAPAVVAVDSAEIRSAPYSVAPLESTLPLGATLYVSNSVTNGWRGAHVSGVKLGYIRDADVQVDGEPLSMVRAKVTPPDLVPPRIAQPWIVRLEVDLAGESGGFLSADENSASSMAITVGRSLTERFSTEMTIGLDPFPGDHDGNIAPGLVTMAVARMATVLDSRTGRHALTLAAGPMLIAGGPYGVVAFGHGEAGYEFHGENFTILLALGPDVTFNDSRRVQPVAGCTSGLFGGSFLTCAIPFNRGDVFPHFRLGVGFSF